ncbi:NADP-dependent oxidoreductase [Embleya sp. NPDC050493]|uniref:NADP-dependent oxidoreductase n=1 Tax=Embleya sp. NPDC050493 TaxID=3363989 RepID=UPI0037AC592E
MSTNNSTSTSTNATTATATAADALVTTGREIRLAARPVGAPTAADFELVTAAIPALTEGRILVRNTWMSVDPYMRGRMDDVESYIPPFELGAVLDGSAVGEVIASRSDAIPVGATVSHFAGWREYAVVDAATAVVLDTSAVPAQAYLGVLGTTGLTAYAALTEVAPVRQGDTVFVSGAAGAVGSVAGQIARKLGAARVIGSAGGPAKAARLRDEFGYDVALDYRAGAIGNQLAQAAPEGIDVYLDHVGGDHLEAAIANARVGARFALIGAISGYNATEPVPGPSNIFQAYVRRLNLRGLLVTDHFALFPEFTERAIGWLGDGSLRTEETVFEGIEQAPAALLGVLDGVNTGKMLVRLAD